MDETNLLLTIIRDDHAFKARIFAFAALNAEQQRLVLDSGRTIAFGAERILAFDA